MLRPWMTTACAMLLLTACARPEVTCPLPSPVTIASERDTEVISTPLARWLLTYDEVCG